MTGVSRALVRMAVGVLPSGPARERYRQEFLADLDSLGGRARLGFALGVAANVLALRIAIDRQQSAADLEFAPRRRGLRCRLGMHRYRYEHNPDGDPYLRCTRCGDDKGGVLTSGESSLPGNIALSNATTWG